MSDNVNSAIVQPIGIDVLGQYQKWAALQGQQQQNALTQQQTQGAAIGNQIQNLSLSRQGYALGLLGVPGVGAPSAAQQGAPVAAAPVQGAGALAGVGGVTAPSNGSGQNALAPLGAPQQPAAPQAPPGSVAARVFQGVPMPDTAYSGIVQANGSPESVAKVNENRRQIIFQNVAGAAPEDYVPVMTQLAQRGWVSPDQLQDAINHPEGRARIIQATMSPENYQAAQSAALAHNMQYDPNTGQPTQYQPAIQAAGATAQSTEGGKQGVDQQYGTVKVNVPNGSGGFTEQQMSPAQAAQFYAAHPGSAPVGGAPSGGALTGLGAPGAYPATPSPVAARSLLPPQPQMIPGSNLPPSDPRSATAAGSLLGGIPAAHYDPNAAPVPMNPSALAAAAGGAATPPGGWGQSAPNVPAAPVRSTLPPGAAPITPAVPTVPGAPTQSAPVAPGVPGQTVLTPQQTAGMGIAKSNIEADRADVNTGLQQVQQAQIAKTQLRQLSDLVPQINPGSFAEMRQGVQNFLATYGPKVVDKFVADTTGIDASKAGATQEFVKQSINGVASAESQTFGKNAGLGTTEIYLKAYPNIGMQANAIKDMTNLLSVAQQRIEDFGLQKADFFNAQQPTIYSDPTKYKPIQQFDEAFAQSHPPQLYAGAAAALNGHPYAEWSQGLSVPQQTEALRIVGRVNPSATVLDSKGVARTFAAPATQSSAQ